MTCSNLSFYPCHAFFLPPLRPPLFIPSIRSASFGRRTASTGTVTVSLFSFFLVDLTPPPHTHLLKRWKAVGMLQGEDTLQPWRSLLLALRADAVDVSVAPPGSPSLSSLPSVPDIVGVQAFNTAAQCAETLIMVGAMHVSLSNYILAQSIYIYIYISAYLSIYTSAYLSVYLST